jgi:hypothetical protein
MPYVSPERIGSSVIIGDDGRELEDLCRFREVDLLNLVEDLDEINELPIINSEYLHDMIKHGEPIECDHVIIDHGFDIRNLNLAKDENGFFIICSPISITNSLIQGKVYFTKSIFKEPVDFTGSQFGSNAYFYESKFDGSVFQRSIFNGVANFRESKFISSAYFGFSIFYREANFYLSEFNRDAAFTKSEFLDDVNFGGIIFKGEKLTFIDARFNDPRAQEDACKRAKSICEKNGDRESASYYFYREMEAIRKQKGVLSRSDFSPQKSDRSIRAETWLMIKRFFWYDIFEYIFIQGMFGYGVHPERLMFYWGVIVVVFSILYSVGNGLNGDLQPFDYLKFSLATAIAPGYIATIISPGSTGYDLASEYQAVAIIESILGTFMWAGFIATFAKKYMK